MKKMMSAMIAVLFALMFLPAETHAIGVDLGPFSLRLNGDVVVDSPAFHYYNDPICEAIRNHQLIILYTKQNDKIDRVFVEPYAFGYNEKNELILQGFQIDQIKFDNNQPDSDQGEGYFGGILSTFAGSDWKDIPIDKVVNIEVVKDSNFKVREDVLKNIQNENTIVKPICFIQL